MYARAIYAVGDPAQVEHSLEGLRTEAPKLLADSPGFRSFGLFADREQGKIAMGTWWETEHDRANSDAHLGQRRTELLSPFADSVLIANAEIVAFAGTPEMSSAGTFRLGRFMIEPDRVDDLVRLFKEAGLPRMQDLTGFCGAAMFIDRERGTGSVGSLFTDRAALAASRGPQSAARREAVQRTGLRLMCLEEFEVVLLEDNLDASQAQ
jgi:heme-degrading monooxygenase HmoA